MAGALEPFLGGQRYRLPRPEPPKPSSPCIPHPLFR